MLKHLSIRNVALITKLDLEFQQGLNVLSGETGSGKSIVVDSLAFVLGERADKNMIQFGAETALVEAVFELEENSAVFKQLEAAGYETDSELMLSRKLSHSGKNECRINGRLCTQSILKEVASGLVDIFGQSEHLFLLNPEKHLEIVDAFSTCSEAESVAEAARRFRAASKELNQFGGSPEERERKMDLLRFQMEEIEQADLKDGEAEELQAARRRMQNAEKIADRLSLADHALDSEERGALRGLTDAMSALHALSDCGASFTELSERLQSAYYDLSDVSAVIRDLKSETYFDENEMNRMEERLDLLKKIHRKYGAELSDVRNYYEKIKDEAESLANAEDRIAALTAQRDAAKKDWYAASTRWSEQRKKTADELRAKIESELKDLGMKGSRFQVEFLPPPSYDEATVSDNGFDRAEFYLSANRGEPLKPLMKVISGGEMSRFMLAIKNITAELEKIPTMVFDEIDTGISGLMAQMVALKLNAVSRKYQAIVVTHLPQIAAMGDANFVIEKAENAGRTETTVRQLSPAEKVAEISRLMGGANIGEFGALHAQELIAWALSQKSQ